MRPTLALLRTELRLLARTPAAILPTLLLPVLAAVVIACIPAARQPNPVFGGASVSQAYTAPLVMFSTTMAAVVVMPQILGSYREIGYLRRLRTTPVSPAHLLAAVAIEMSGIALLASAVIVLFPRLLGVEAPARPGILIAAVLASLAAFLAIGMVLCAVIPSAKVAAGIGNVVAVLMWFTAGMWVPRTEFPGWLRHVSDLTPGGAAASLLGGETDVAGMWAPLLVCAVWAVASAVIATRAFRWG